ncbi:hypothetical protein RM52_04055 [Microbacterium hominis]|uniref:Nudix hydrolase domain-containing protein n=2 Tax=Microbacterium hominis TaxID=162426 RepID=A0A0B4CDR5_9MICO|nr:hypothetical protein RM52_04055 [Microbacterium hominis]
MPIACVDFVVVRERDRRREIGLILRHSPHGQVWCHLGGRIQRGETIADAIRRHCRETIAAEPVISLNEQPRYVYEWFPPDLAPTDGTAFGNDPRKHSIGLSFLIAIDGEALPRNEANDFRWFSPDALPDDLWPGCGELFRRLGIADYTPDRAA